MSTPLTDRINALTVYSNQKTGASDTTLSDAVTRLVAGYGGGGIENGVEIKAVDSSGRPTSIVFYGSVIGSYVLGTKGTSEYTYSWSESIQFADVIESIGQYGFSYFGAKRTNSEDMEIIFSSGLTTVDVSAFSGCGFTKLSFPETLTGRLSDNVFRGALKLEDVVLPGITSLDTSGGNGNGQFYGCTALENVQVGSVGHGVTVVKTWSFRNCTQTTLTITLYTTGNLVDEHLTKLRDSSYGATGATIIFKASEATTYNGNSYAAGATILTSTPNS